MVIAERINNDIPVKKTIFLYWLGGTGFIIKNGELTIGIDLYLSDACKNKKGDYKRLFPSLVDPGDLKLDYLIATHQHGDHFDLGSINKFINENTVTKLIGPNSVLNLGKTLGLDPEKFLNLNRGENLKLGDVDLKGVLADHGKLAPDCIGIIMTISEKNVYFTSDTCFRPDLPQLIELRDPIDLLIVPINGKDGNPDPKDAAYISAWVKPRIVIPSHFWLFKEHGGDPGLFLEYCKDIVPKTRVEILAQGEKLVI